MAIGLARHRVGQGRNAAGMERSGASREARHRKVEAAPEQMDRAHLAEIGRAEALQHPIDRDRRVEKARHGLGSIGPLCLVVVNGTGSGTSLGPPVEFGRAAERADEIEKACVKVGNRHRAERELRPAPVGGGPPLHDRADRRRSRRRLARPERAMSSIPAR